MSKATTKSKTSSAEVVDFPPLEDLKSRFTTKSAIIRHLASEFADTPNLRSRIAKHLDIRYQHVRNVLTTPLKRQLVNAD